MLFLEQTQGFGGAAPGDQQQAPSLYELLMQERMASGFKPALEYLVQTVCDTYPQVSTTLPVRNFEESYALLMAIIERYFLNRYDSLASEKFYGMKRVMYNVTPPAGTDSNAPATPTTAPLSDQARRRSLMLAVVVPYLKAKLDGLHRSVVNESTYTSTHRDTDVETEQHFNSTLFQRKWHAFLRQLKKFALLAKLKRVFVKGYPFLHLIYEASFFLYQWLYLFGDTPYFSPFLRRLGVVLVRVTPTDETAIIQRQNDYREKFMTALSGDSFIQRLRRGLVRTSWAIYDHSYVLLMVGIGCYKFLEWMYSDEGSAAIKVRHTGSDAPTPPPPLPPAFAGNASVMLSTLDSSTCPLCQKRRVNPAASTSGFVFCYPCIYRHIEEHGTCPITRMHCDVASIVKIYDDATP